MTTNAMLIYGLGFLAQALFGARMLIQWILSERAGKIVSPTLFWQTSLVASFLFMIYGLLRFDAVIIIGQVLSYYIYIRNLQLKKAWSLLPRVVRVIFFVSPVITLGYVIGFNLPMLEQLRQQNDFTQPIMLLGAIGQLLLNLRFVYQWYYSERIQESVLPVGFWLLSLVGALLVLVYAWHRKDPVLLIAQGMGSLVYIRNGMIGIQTRHAR